MSGRPEGLHYIGVKNAIKPDTTGTRSEPDTTGTWLKPDTTGTALTRGIHQLTNSPIHQLTECSGHCLSGGTESSAASAIPAATCGRIPMRM